MGQKLALIIGNSEYEDGTLAQLATPDADANTLAQILRDPEIGGFDEVAALVNQPSTTIRRAISSFFVGRGRDDLLVLYFSGHGIQDDRGQLFLAVKDTEHSLLRGTAIPAAFITEEMDNSRSRRQVLILDCCHSGAFSRGMKGAPGISVGTAAAFEGTGFGRVVLTATDSTQYAWEGDQVVGKADNSVFTQHLIQGLRSRSADTDGDGRITLDELYDYVYDKVVRETPKQTPSKWSYGQQGEIVIAQNLHPVVTPAEIPLDLRQTIEDSRPWVREGAVRELDRLLKGSHPGLALAAKEALKRLADDDSRRVASMAAESLGAYSQAQPSTEGAQAAAVILVNQVNPVNPVDQGEQKVEERHTSERSTAEQAARQPRSVATRTQPLATSLAGSTWMGILLITAGWMAGGWVTGTLFWNKTPWLIHSALGGAILGLTIGLVLFREELPSHRKQILMIAGAWTAGWIIDSALGVSLVQSFGSNFAQKFYFIFSSWDLTFHLGAGVGAAIASGIDGAIGGLAIGLALRQTQAGISDKQIVINTLGWAIPSAVGGGIYWAVNGPDWYNHEGIILGLIVLLAISAVIGSAVMFAQLGKTAQHSKG